MFARLVRAMFVVMPRVLGQDPPEVPLAEDQHVIKALTPFSLAGSSFPPYGRRWASCLCTRLFLTKLGVGLQFGE